MRVIFDTNVIVSAFLTEGLSNVVFRNCIKTQELVISDWIINETLRILRKKFKLNESLIREIAQFLRKNFDVVKPEGEPPRTCRDKDDDNILNLAESAGANVIVTGDRDLLIIKKYKRTRIISPREFYSEYVHET